MQYEEVGSPRAAARCATSISEWDLTVVRAFEANRAGITAAAGRICGQADADDIAHEVFMRVWSNPAAFDPSRGTLTSYFYVIVRGMAIDRLRSAASRRQRELRDVNGVIRTTDGAGDRVADGERVERLGEAMSRLRPAERDALAAVYFARLTYREAAERLGLPEGTLKSRIRLALVRLRVDMDAFGSWDDDAVA